MVAHWIESKDSHGLYWMKVANNLTLIFNSLYGLQLTPPDITKKNYTRLHHIPWQVKSNEKKTGPDEPKDQKGHIPIYEVEVINNTNIDVSTTKRVLILNGRWHLVFKWCSVFKWCLNKMAAICADSEWSGTIQKSHHS